MAEPVRAYLEQIGRYALLRPEQEVELARLVQRAQQLEQQAQLSPTEQRELRRGRRARERMIQANLRLVVTVAKTYQGRGLDLMDLVQEGSLGLIRAVEKFDPTLGYRFSTYAWNWIRQAISRGLETKGRTLRLPIHVTQQLRALHRAHERLWQQGLSTDLGAVAAEAGVDLKAASLALRMAPGTLSLDTPAVGRTVICCTYCRLLSRRRWMKLNAETVGSTWACSSAICPNAINRCCSGAISPPIARN